MARAKRNQSDLPGMQDRRIEELHCKLIELESVRTERMRLTKQESELSEACIELMRRYEKEESGYNFEGVEAKVEPPDGKFKIKVKVAHADDEPKENGEVEHVAPEDGAESNDMGAVQ